MGEVHLGRQHDADEPLLYMWANTPYKTIHDVRTASVAPKCGVTGTGNTGYYLPKLLEETIGAKFQLVTGYEGGASIELAVERGEVQCRAFTIQVFFGREPFHTWRSKNLVRVLVQGGKKRDPRLPETPLISELMDQYKVSEANRRLVTVMLGSVSSAARRCSRRRVVARSKSRFYARPTPRR